MFSLSYTLLSASVAVALFSVTLFLTVGFLDSSNTVVAVALSCAFLFTSFRNENLPILKELCLHYKRTFQKVLMKNKLS